MLVHAADFLREHGQHATSASYFAQEMNWNNAAIAKINSVLHGLEADIKAGSSTITDPQFLENGQVQRFSLVLANFPFSDQFWWLKPGQETDDKKKGKLKKETFGKDGFKDAFGRFGRSTGFHSPPAGYGDYAFILHILSSLTDNGRAGIVCPQGVLFRGQPEVEDKTDQLDKDGNPKIKRRKADDEYLIRRALIEARLIDAVISLPLNVFYGAGVPACLLILRKQRPAERHDRVLLVYAARHYRELSAQNELRPQDVMRMLVHVHTYGDAGKVPNLVEEHAGRIHEQIDALEEEEVGRIEAEYQPQAEKIAVLDGKSVEAHRKKSAAVTKRDKAKVARAITKLETQREKLAMKQSRACAHRRSVLAGGCARRQSRHHGRSHGVHRQSVADRGPAHVLQEGHPADGGGRSQAPRVASMRPSARYRNAPPRAGAMIEALRGLGYSTATALADLVDNSIAAGAGGVNLLFVWEGPASHIIIQDDGRGMDHAGLDRAMRLGHQSPLDARADDDLGRFGQGLKTASFSQCRGLTVASRQEGGAVACLRWDLDVLASSGDDVWRLLVGPADGSRRSLDPLHAVPAGHPRPVGEPRPHRDARLLGTELPGSHRRDRESSGDGLSPVPDQEAPRLRIAINDRAVKPWGPFLASHHSTWSSPTAVLAPGVAARCHVLPHKDRLDTRQQEAAAGPDGWTAQQGSTSTATSGCSLPEAGSASVVDVPG